MADHHPPRIDLIVFAKTVESRVKTRIGRALGDEAARNIYRELLQETAVGIAPFAHHVAFAGSDQPGELRSYFPNASSWYPQSGNSLGARMRMACLHRMTQGASGCIVIGCDCPERPAGDIQAAIGALTEGVDVVLGPAKDGGYHFAGVNHAGLAIFDATRWSQSDLLDETRSIVDRHHLQMKLLPVRYDVDTVEDYHRWRGNGNAG